MTDKTLAPIALFCAALFVSGAASALCVKVPTANLRKGPGTSYGKSWKVYKYMPLEKIGQQGRWEHVRDVDGDTHWVYDRLVTGDMQCAVVKVDKANVRTGPGTNYAKSPLSPVERYYSFKVLGQKDGWVQVQDEVFNSGWVSNKLLWIR